MNGGVCERARIRAAVFLPFSALFPWQRVELVYDES